MIESGLFDVLHGASSISGLVDQRIFPLLMPQAPLHGSAQQPSLVYRLIAVDRQVRYCGTDALVQARFQIDCYATTYLASKELAEQVRFALLDYSGPMGDQFARICTLDNESDLLDPDPGLYRVLQSWVIWHTARA